MRVAIASDGEGIESGISELGGRAPFYLIFEDGILSETIRNPFAKGSGGAGYSVAYLMADKKIELVIAGKIGGNMASALEERGVDYKEEDSRKSIKEVIESLAS